MAGRMSRVFIRQQAEALRKKGMYQKARDLYQEMLGSMPKLPPEIKSGIEGQIKQIELEMKADAEPKASSTPLPARPEAGQGQRPDMHRILEHVINGSILIETTAAFRYLINHYPEEPDLLRIYAGRLASDQRLEEAVETYARAANLFFRTGRIFQGWLCKILEWRIQKAPKEQLIETQKTIRGANPTNAIDHFVKQLTWAERIAIFSQFSLIAFPAGTTVLSAGDGQEDLYLVVSGVLKGEGPEGRPKRSKPRTLGESNFFGFTGPADHSKAVDINIRSATRVELVKITREHLLNTFRRLPEAEKKFQQLCCRPESAPPAAPERTRKGERYFIRTFMHLTVLPLQVDQAALVLKGFSHEISLTGVSFTPEQNDVPEKSSVLKEPESFIGRKVQAKVLAEGITVEVLGRIVRTSKVMIYGKKLLCFGIQFAELSPLVRWMIFTFAANASVNLPAAEHEYLFSCPFEHNWRV